MQHKPHQDLSDWFYKLKKNEIAEYELIGRVIKKIRLRYDLPKCNLPVRQKDLGTWIANCRFDMETRYGKTLYCVRGVGYKIASPNELAIYTARFLRRTLTHADRTMRLADIVDRRYMPKAIRDVFFDQAGKMKRFRSQGSKFMIQFADYLKAEQKKQWRLQHNEEDHKAE